MHLQIELAQFCLGNDEQKIKAQKGGYFLWTKVGTDGDSLIQDSRSKIQKSSSKKTSSSLIQDPRNQAPV